MSDQPLRLPHDWYPGDIPANVQLGCDVFIDTSYAFAAFHSKLHPGLSMGAAAGSYDRSSFVVGPSGVVTVGDYTCLNGTYIICEERITIGAHCLLAWGSVLSDSWAVAPVAARRAALRAVVQGHLPSPAPPQPVTLEDNVWVGFGAVVLPGTTLGRGCVVGCRTVIAMNVPPYAVVVGDPARIVRFLEPDDDDQARAKALQEQSRSNIPR